MAKIMVVDDMSFMSRMVKAAGDVAIGSVQ